MEAEVMTFSTIHKPKSNQGSRTKPQKLWLVLLTILVWCERLLWKRLELWRNIVSKYDYQTYEILNHL
jgi:hypothetical protein